MSNKNAYKAAAERQKVRAGGTEPIAPVETTPVVPESVEETPVPTPVPTENPLVDVFTKKAAGKTYSIHLSPSSIKKVDLAAKQLKCSRSKVIDLLIQKYL